MIFNRTRLSNLLIINNGKCKNFGKKGAWAYPGTIPIFGYHQLSQEP